MTFSFKLNKCAKNNNQRVCQCRTWAAQRACGRPRSQWPSGSFRWGRQTGRREPNTHQPAHLDHCWTEAWTKRWDKETPDKITQTRNNLILEPDDQDRKYDFKKEEGKWAPVFNNDDWTDLCKIWRWVFASAQVGQSPHCISGCCETVGFSEQPAQSRASC